MPMDPFLSHTPVRNVYDWTQAEQPLLPPEEQHCPTRDLLTARLDRCRRAAAEAGLPEQQSYLLHAILGEIGNNAFDHNLGAWRDHPGIMFLWGSENGSFSAAIGDRGQGVLTTLRRVKPDLQSDSEALKSAFLERLSGRAPERRGNGLKFVRRTLLQDGIDLFFQSGTAHYSVIQKQECWETAQSAVPGCFAAVSWSAS
jgi:hypothetical protein